MRETTPQLQFNVPARFRNASTFASIDRATGTIHHFESAAELRAFRKRESAKEKKWHQVRRDLPRLGK